MAAWFAQSAVFIALAQSRMFPIRAFFSDIVKLRTYLHSAMSFLGFIKPAKPS